MWACERCGDDVMDPKDIHEVLGMMLCNDCFAEHEDANHDPRLDAKLADADSLNDDKWIRDHS